MPNSNLESEPQPKNVALPLFDVFPVSYIRGLSTQLTLEERSVVVNQFIALIENFYVHLPLKRSTLAVDPIQRGRLILNQLPDYFDDTDFLGDLLSAFNELRDLHTNFVLPTPWQELVAFLPFLVEGYRDENGLPRFAVSRISPYVDLGPDFLPGVEVTHWNGMPMVQAVLQLGPQTAGANPRASIRRALAMLTTRTLSSQLPPREDWVRLSYIGAKGPAQIEYPWLVMASPPPAAKPASDYGSSPLAMRLGIDYPSQEVQRVRKRILFPERFEFEQRVNQVLKTSGRSAAESILGDTDHTSSLFPQNLSFGTVETPSGTFGYLRIWNFEVDDVEGFTAEIRRILQQAPESGIVLDVRGNPGGTIPAGERILQFFTDRRIEPEPVSFRATDLNRFMVEALQELAPWRHSLNLALRTGDVFSQGYPLTSVEEANDKGRVYRGPVVVIIDAMSYSTCDFFVAGIQDHRIGKVLGVDKSTGAGGANVWTQDLLRQIWQNAPNNPLTALPRGASMRVAARRSTRVGESMDLPVEGLGTEADEVHSYTLNDQLHNNVDLLAAAGRILAAR